MPEKYNSTGVHLRLVLTMIFWGGTFVAGRLLAEELHPQSAASFRFLLASLMLLTVVFIQNRSFPGLTGKQWIAMALLGLTGVFSYNILFFTGLQTVEAGRASMIIAVNPVVTAILAILLFRERFDIPGSAGMVLSVTGALIVISRGQPGVIFAGGIGVGELCIIGCVLSWSAYTLIGKHLLTNIEPLVVVGYSCALGTLYLTVLALFTGHLMDVKVLSAKSTGCLLYVAFFGTTLGFVWFYDGVKQLGAGKASMYVNLVPVSGILLGSLLLGERLEGSLVLGGALVFLGLYLINRKARPLLKT